MKKKLFLACLISVSVGLAALAGEQKPTCAVLTFDAGEGITVGEAKFISDRFAALLTQLEKYDIVARSRMNEILKVAEFNRADHCSATDCAVEAGKILQVQYMVFGTVGRFRKLTSLNTSLVEVETGKIIRTAVADHTGDLTEFGKSAPADNIKSLLLVKQTPKDWTTLLIVAQQGEYFMSGEVKNPGRYSLTGDLTLQQVIVTAGGYTGYANRRKVQINRDEKKLFFNVRNIEKRILSSSREILS